MKALLAVVAVVCVLWCAHAGAQVYRCTAADGSVAYQDHACAPGQAQTLVDVPARAAPGYVPPPPAAPVPEPPAPAQSALPPAAPPPPALPALYACVGAVNQKQYFTAHPPGPYLAPLGVMGYPPQGLGQTYGAPGGAGISAPEAAPKPRIGGPAIATGMTEVQDYCLPATHAQVCAHLQREYDENYRRLRMAMPREQPPLEARDRRLTDQLRACR